MTVYMAVRILPQWLEEMLFLEEVFDTSLKTNNMGG